MKNRVVAQYYGTKDTIQVSALVLDDSGTASIHPQLKKGTVRLLKNEVEIMQMVVEAVDYNEEKQGFYVFFVHPPVQRHLYVVFDVEMFNGDTSTSRVIVGLKELVPTDAATNPVIPVRPAKDYTNTWDADGRSRSPI